jgi:hypothetical protein
LRGAGAFGEIWRGGIGSAGLVVGEAVGVVGGVGIDGEEVAGAGDEVFFGLGEGGKEVAEGVLEGLGVVAVVPLVLSLGLVLSALGGFTYRAVVEPSEDEVVVPLYGYGICVGCAVGFEVVTAVLERHAVFALELLVVPLGDFRMCKQSVVATSEASLQALSDVVVEREVGSEGVV